MFDKREHPEYHRYRERDITYGTPQPSCIRRHAGSEISANAVAQIEERASAADDLKSSDDDAICRSSRVVKNISSIVRFAVLVLSGGSGISVNFDICSAGFSAGSSCIGLLTRAWA